MKIKQYGIQRSGTNYLRQLLLDNVENICVYENSFGWKHGYPLSREALNKWAKDNKVAQSKLEDDIHPIIIIKNPYSWCQSIKKFRADKFNFENLYKRYNSLYKAYKKLYIEGHDVFAKSYIIKYEDLLRNPKAEMESLARKLGAELKETFINPDKVNMSKKFTTKERDFYLNSENFGLDNKKIEEITNIIDWETIGFYGYERK